MLEERGKGLTFQVVLPHELHCVAMHASTSVINTAETIVACGWSFHRVESRLCKDLVSSCKLEGAGLLRLVFSQFL